MGGDDAHDVSRIMRLPGTTNLADERERQRQRCDAPAQLDVYDFTRRFRVTDFPEPPKEMEFAAGGRWVVSLPADLPSVSLDNLPDTVSARTKMLIACGRDPEDSGRYPSRSEVLFAVLCKMVRAGVDDDTIAAVILDRDHAISAHIYDQPRPMQYAQGAPTDPAGTRRGGPPEVA